MLRKTLIGITVFAIAVVSILLFSSQIIAQEEGTFSDSFDQSLDESYEYSQDVLVSDGVLQINSGNFIFKNGNWQNPSLSLKFRIGSPGHAVLNYHTTDEGSYSLNIFTEGQHSEMALIKGKPGEESELGTSILENLNIGDWNTITVSFDGQQHQVILNDQTVITASDQEALSSGGIGFFVHGESKFEVDDISVNATVGVLVAEGEEGVSEEAPMEEGAEPEITEEQMREEEAAGEGGTATGQEEQAAVIQTEDASWKEFMNSIFVSGAELPDLQTFLINLALSALFAYILGLVYIYWGASLSNRRKFAANFILLTITTTFIILVVRSSVALSLGLVGALSIVRFRAAIKEPEELAYLFLAIGLGIGLGDNQRLITTVAFAVAILILGLMRLFRRSRADANMHLNISTSPQSKLSLEKVQDALKPYCPKMRLLRFDENDKVLEMSFVVEFKKMEDLGAAKEALQKLSDKVEITFLDNKGVW